MQGKFAFDPVGLGELDAEKKQGHPGGEFSHRLRLQTIHPEKQTGDKHRRHRQAPRPHVGLVTEVPTDVQPLPGFDHDSHHQTDERNVRRETPKKQGGTQQPAGKKRRDTWSLHCVHPRHNGTRSPCKQEPKTQGYRCEQPAVAQRMPFASRTADRARLS